MRWLVTAWAGGCVLFMAGVRFGVAVRYQREVDRYRQGWNAALRALENIYADGDKAVRR